MLEEIGGFNEETAGLARARMSEKAVDIDGCRK